MNTRQYRLGLAAIVVPTAAGIGGIAAAIVMSTGSGTSTPRQPVRVEQVADVPTAHALSVAPKAPKPAVKHATVAPAPVQAANPVPAQQQAQPADPTPPSDPTTAPAPATATAPPAVPGESGATGAPLCTDDNGCAIHTGPGSSHCAPDASGTVHCTWTPLASSTKPSP